MLYKAVVDLSSRAARARDNSKKDFILGRLDSGIELDLGLHSPSSKVNFKDDFLDVKKGDVFRRIEIPKDKRLIYVEKVSREINANDDGSNDAVFCLDIESSNCEAIVTKGYVPVDCLEVEDAVVENDVSCCKCIDCEGRLEETLKLHADIKQLDAENKQLKAQLQELKLTNDGLLDSMSWNGDDDSISLLSVRPSSPRFVNPRLIRSPRPLRPRSRTARSDSSDPDTDIFLKVFERPIEKQEDILEEEIQLSCTLCSRKIKLTELEIHSKICSSASASKEVTLSVPNMLITNVTQVNHASSTEQLLKIIAKTTLKSYDGHLFEVNRDLEDFVWFRETLQLLNPGRIVPSIKMHGTINGNFREIQRFLKRLTGHKVLKTHDLVRDFLTQKDIAATRKRYDQKNLRRSTTPLRKPISKPFDPNSLLYRASIYISTLLKNLENLVNHFKERMDRKLAADEISKRFGDLSDGEMNETYLKIATSGLSRITQETSLRKEDCHESALVEELESLHGSLKEAENLLVRVEAKRDNYLFWNEEMRVYEQQNGPDRDVMPCMKDLYFVDDRENSPSQKAAITQKWAEASANCDAAKTSLENICKHLSEELFEFDIVKENELKDILVDFADGKFQYYEKLQSKWYGVRIMLDTDLSPKKRGYDIV